MLTDEFLKLAEESVLCWLATADAKGNPSVSPKEVWATKGKDQIVIADIASAGSVSNIMVNSSVCVSFVEIFKQRGFKAKGIARLVVPSDEDFYQYAADLLKLVGDRFNVRRVIVVEVKKITRIVAPSYILALSAESEL